MEGEVLGEIYLAHPITTVMLKPPPLQNELDGAGTYLSDT